VERVRAERTYEWLPAIRSAPQMKPDLAAIDLDVAFSASRRLLNWREEHKETRQLGPGRIGTWNGWVRPP